MSGSTTDEVAQIGICKAERFSWHLTKLMHRFP
jgi:hypothetical protein